MVTGENVAGRKSRYMDHRGRVFADRRLGPAGGAIFFPGKKSLILDPEGGRDLSGPFQFSFSTRAKLYTGTRPSFRGESEFPATVLTISVDFGNIQFIKKRMR